MNSNTKIICIIVSSFLLAAAASPGTEWTPVITINDIKMSVDKESIIFPSYQIARAWRRYELKTHLKKDSKEYSSLLVYSEEDCEGNRFRVLEEVLEFTDSTTQKDSYPDAEWETIAPGTFNQHFHSYVCK